MNKELMKGSIDILLLSELRLRDKYGYEIVKNLKEKSNDLYQMSEGTLYPALKRMESKGLVESYWGESDTGGRRKYYRITSMGSAALKEKVSEWKNVIQIIKLCTEGAI